MSRTTRVLAQVVALLFAPACDKPLAVSPTKAPTAGLSVCWRDPDDGDLGIDRALRTTLANRLKAAGYVLVKRGCDLSVSWAYTTRGNDDDNAFRTARITVRTGDGTLLDEHDFQFGQSDLPADDADRLAIVLVNAINASPKIATMVAPATEAYGAVSVAPSGIKVGRGVANMALLTPSALDLALGSVPHERRLDVAVERGALWRTVENVFDALMADSRNAVRLHLPGGVIAELDLVRSSTSRGSSSWLTLWLSGNWLDVTWRTDRPCAQVPRSFTSNGWHYDAMRSGLKSCNGDCFDRLVFADKSTDDTEYSELLAIAAQAHRGVFELDPQGRYAADPTCKGDPDVPKEDVDVIIGHHLGAIAHCSEDYQGDVRVVLTLGTDGHAADTVVEFGNASLKVWDSEKTCVATVLANLSFPIPAHEQTISYVLHFDGRHHVQRADE